MSRECSSALHRVEHLVSMWGLGAMESAPMSPWADRVEERWEELRCTMARVMTTIRQDYGGAGAMGQGGLHCSLGAVVGHDLVKRC